MAMHFILHYNCSYQASENQSSNIQSVQQRLLGHLAECAVATEIQIK